MPIGLVSDDEFQKELDRVSEPKKTIKFTKGIVRDAPAKGRGKAKQVPEPLRKLIGASAISDGNQEAKVLAESLGVNSQSSISAYKNGATSTTTYHDPDKGLAKHVKNARLRVTDGALAKLQLALDHITGEKLEDAKVGTIAHVAAQMATVHKNMSEGHAEEGHGVNFVFVTPRQKKEEKYEVIDVHE